MGGPSSDDPEATIEELTEELTRDLLAHFVETARYWAHLPDVDPATGRVQTVESRCLGVVFSILATLDGCGDFPAFNLAVEPAPDTPKYAESDRTYEGVVIRDMLHERMPA